MLKTKPSSHNGFALVLAWPETRCKEAGAWYDGLMSALGFNKKGYYKVGHAAIVLIDYKSGSCRYFDFGRYHAPHGFGRVRDAFTDHDLKIHTQANFSSSRELLNRAQILDELWSNASCHGSGYILSGLTRVSIEKSMKGINKLRQNDFLPYGPFVRKGTNCSRFVATVLEHSGISFLMRLRLFFQVSISPSPKGNITAVGNAMAYSGHTSKPTSKKALISELQLS